MNNHSVSAKPIGLIVPPASGEVPYDGPLLYPQVNFMARGLGLPAVTPAGYDQVIDRVTDLACQLSEAGAETISLMGTSLSFYRGVEFNRELQRSMEQATGKPCTTMSNAVLRGLNALDARRVVLATAYIDDVNQRLTTFLRDSGFEVLGDVGLALTDIANIHSVTTETLVQLCGRAYELAPQAEAVVLSCGGLHTLEAIPEVEKRYGIPVVSSSPAGFWDAMRTAGLDAKANGFGRLIELG